MWKLNDRHLKNNGSKKKIKRKIRKHLEMNEANTKRMKINKMQRKLCFKKSLELQRSMLKKKYFKRIF